MKKNRTIHSRKIYIVNGILLGLTALVIAIVLMNVQNTRQTEQSNAAAIDAGNNEMTEIAKRLETTTPYAELPENDRQAYLENKAVEFSVDRRYELTPVLIRNMCIERGVEELRKVAKNLYAASEGKEKMTQHATMLRMSEQQIRTTCYESYDPSGKYDQPALMQHP